MLYAVFHWVCGAVQETQSVKSFPWKASPWNLPPQMTNLPPGSRDRLGPYLGSGMGGIWQEQSYKMCKTKKFGYSKNGSKIWFQKFCNSWQEGLGWNKSSFLSREPWPSGVPPTISWPATFWILLALNIWHDYAAKQQCSSLFLIDDYKGTN